MKIISLTAAGVLLFLLTASATGEVLDLKTPIKLYNGTQIMQLDVGNSTPTTADWNNDGRTDLIVGHFMGYIHLFVNRGSNLNPVFNGSVKIKSNGTPIQTSLG